MSDAEAYSAFVRELREISLLGSVSSVLEWDERTQLPPRGAENRADQLSLLARMIHDRFTSPRMGESLEAVEGSALVKDPESDAAANARETRRSYDRARKLPSALVEEMTKVATLAQHAWAEARAKSDYHLFEPWLARTLDLKRRQADCIGYASNPYDALLDEYEPGATASEIDAVFSALRGPLVELIGRITQSTRKAPVEILERSYPPPAQEQLAREAAKAIGFDFSAGRLDVSLHPFCADLGRGDTRMTTRYDPNRFGGAFFGVMHESGHALYDQGLPAEHFGTPVGEAVSLGIHESQSRLWENFVGRSLAFWQYFLPKVGAAFPDSLRDVGEDEWYFAINDIRPSLIRTESDEATYNLHILLRFELEQAMLRGEVEAADVPAAWNEKMRQYLGLTPPDDAQGCLQDIHWSGGDFGYFPTYTLGNLYAAQFFEKVRQDLGDVDAQFARGEFQPLLHWLRENIHRHGRRYTASQLVARVTGRPLSPAPLLEYLNQKASDLYHV